MSDVLSIFVKVKKTCLLIL